MKIYKVLMEFKIFIKFLLIVDYKINLIYLMFKILC